MMKVADLNRNGVLSFTEMSVNLQGTQYADFAQWIKDKRQAGFRQFDENREGSLCLEAIRVRVRIGVRALWCLSGNTAQENP